MKKRNLSPEDRDLWARYTQSTDPLRPVQRVANGHAGTFDPARPPKPKHIEPFRLGEKASPQVQQVVPSARANILSDPLRMDAKAYKKLRSGKSRPDAVLDLHGMTVEQAHAALRRFVMENFADGRRLLLVVTGKGNRTGSADPFLSPLGVLRHQVPQWLRLPPLSQAILQVTEAHRSHGGAGAYYVYLRRQR